MDEHSTTSNNPYLAPSATLEEIVSPDTIVLADRLTRLGASILDGLIQLAVLAPVIAIIILFTIGFNESTVEILEATEDSILFQLLALVLGIAVFLAINFRLLRDNGQTVGKRICNIKIVRSDGSPADVQHLLLYRYLPVWIIPQIPIVGGIFALLNVLLIFRESRKCLHDDIADTIVIKA
jgi:uncharacterized RDD family membrane protein YckC